MVYKLKASTNMVIKSQGRELLWSTLSLLVIFEPAKSIKLLELDIPKSIALGTRAALSCRWQLGPADVLYSVKWYMDGKEFFRHVPRDVEPRRRFPLPGVNVEDSDTLGSKLMLSPATLETGGRYRCEVSGERPLFPTVSDYADMDVVALPDHGPIITGFQSKYRIRDRVRVNCTSGHSQPATQLSWYINGEPLPTGEYTTSYRSKNALIVTQLTLDFEVTEVHFRKNALRIKCLATITPIYWKSSEEIAIQENTRVYHYTQTISRRRTGADKVHDNVANRIPNFVANSFKSLSFFGVICASLLSKFLS